MSPPDWQEAERAFLAWVERRRAGVDGEGVDSGVAVGGGEDGDAADGEAPDPLAEDLEQGLDEAARSEFRRMREDYLRFQGAGEAASEDAGTERRIGEFRLLRMLGRGAMGEVWEAHQDSLDRRVALKLLYPHLGLSGRWTERFLREAQIGGRLAHPALVGVFAVGEEDGTHYIAQELVPGGRTLADWIAERAGEPRLDDGHYRQVASLFAELADGLGIAHQAGVLHRDVKPANVLLDGERPRLADFGLARSEHELALSQTGELLGTPFYMSPEQVAAGRVELDARSDQFSLGATLYEALTFERAFNGDTREQVAHKILLDDPPEPRSVRSRVPRDLAAICMRALEKRPEQRYLDLAAFAADLRCFVAGESVDARLPGPAARGLRWLRRRPGALLSVGVVVVALVAVTLLMLDAQAARDDADAQALQARAAEQTARRVEEFLVATFLDLAPGGALGREATAEDLLAHATARAREQLAEEPVLRSELLLRLGLVYHGLGDLDEAEPLLREALDLREEHLDGVDQRTLEAGNKLAHLLVGQARYAEAERRYIAAQRGHEQLYGADSPEALENQGNLGLLYWNTGRLEAAEPLVRASLAGTLERWGEDHPNAWRMRSNLGALLYKLGEVDEAADLLEEVLNHQVGNGGPNSQGALAASFLLANARDDQGRDAEARALFEQNLAGSERTWGPVHPNTLGTCHSYSSFLYRLGEYEQAEALARRAYEGRRDRLRRNHPSTLESLSNLVSALLKLDRAKEALPLAEELLAATPADSPHRPARRAKRDAARAAAPPPAGG